LAAVTASQQVRFDPPGTVARLRGPPAAEVLAVRLPLPAESAAAGSCEGRPAMKAKGVAW